MKSRLSITRTIVSGLICLIFLAFTSCKKSNQNPSWDADELVPLARTSVNIFDLTNEEELQADTTGALRLVFNNELFHISLDSLVGIPDTTMTERVDTMILVAFVPGVSVNLSQNQETQLNFGESEIVETAIRAGSIDVSIKSTFSEPTIVTYELTSATKNGNPLIVSESIPAGSFGNPTTVFTSLNLSGYFLDLRGASGTSFNKIVSQTSAMVDPNADTLITQLSDYIEVTYTFNDLRPDYARGYFGNLNYTLSSDEEFGFLANFDGGSIDIEKIDAFFEIRNGLGADIQCKLNNVTMINTEDAVSASLSSSAIGNSININRAIETNNEGNPVIPTIYPIDLSSGQSNIDELFEVVPNKISYDVEMELNPNGHVSSHNDFVYGSSAIEINLDLEMPISIAMDKFILSDTVEFDMGEKTIDDRYLIIDGFIHLYADNWYPLSAEPQLYLMDENYAIIDSLILDNTIVEPGIIDENNIVISSNRTKVSGVITPDKINNLYAASYLKADFSLSTADHPEFVTIYDHYKIDMTLVGDFNYVIDPNE